MVQWEGQLTSGCTVKRVTEVGGSYSFTVYIMIKCKSKQNTIFTKRVAANIYQSIGLPNRFQDPYINTLTNLLCSWMKINFFVVSSKLVHWTPIKNIRYLAPGGGTLYIIPMSSSRFSSLLKASTNEAHSLSVWWIRSCRFSVFSHNDSCHARSATAMILGKIISWRSLSVRITSVQTCACKPA